MKSVKTCSVLVLTLCAIAIIAAAQEEILPGSVNDVMVTVVTPATNTIWGIENPQSDRVSSRPATAGHKLREPVHKRRRAAGAGGRAVQRLVINEVAFQI